MILYRVAPVDPAARPGDPGHPLHIPAQGSSRIDNPRRYRVLYFAEDPAVAVAEAFASRPVWLDEMFLFPVLPEARSSLISIEAKARFVDLDDPDRLRERLLRPSRVASSDRAVTQAWALSIHSEGRWDGVRWWSVRDSCWGVVGVWGLDAVSVRDVEPLSRDHETVRAATQLLRKSWAA